MINANIAYEITLVPLDRARFFFMGLSVLPEV